MGAAPAKRELSLGSRIAIGLVLGIGAGLFFGELARPLEVVGETFVGLLQMTVLPYIVVSLIANVGRLSPDQGKADFGWACAVWAALMIIGCVALVGMSLAFPDRNIAAFFSASPGDLPRSVDLFSMFVPVNFFDSLVRNAVPGVVLFCLFMGAALIGLPNKNSIIEFFDALGEAISRVNGFVVRLTPYGIFALAAAAAGTMSIEEMGRLRGYILIVALTSLILSFVVLPGLVAACTPFRYREVLSRCFDALITAFATGKVLIVLPMLIESTKAMFEEKELRDPRIDTNVEVFYPLIYPFPYLGKLLALLFIPFAAAFVGRSMELAEYGPLLGLGTLSLFGGPIIAIPYLLEVAELPADMFRLFMLSGVVASRFGDLLGVVNLFAFTVISTCLVTGSFAIRWRSLAWTLAASAAVVGVASGASRILLDSAKDDFRRDKIIGSMHLANTDRTVQTTVLSEKVPNPVPLRAGQSRLERIRERGTLRVGYNDDNLPFAFRNARGELVGLDIELANILAQDLGVELELVPFGRSTLAQQLADDHFDIAMSGLAATFGRSEKMHFSVPYIVGTLALVVKDHRARDFDSVEDLARADSLRIAQLTTNRFAAALERRIPQAVSETIPSVEFFFNETHDYDALMVTAEAGAAYSILHPDFQVVVPTARPVSVPLIFAMPLDDPHFSDFVDFWISAQQGTGRIEELAAYWIRGEGAVDVEPRWSVVRNVLGWVD